MVEYWNVDIKEKFPFINSSIKRGFTNKPLSQYPKTIIPSFQYFIIPIMSEAN
jgi:hypothetical protein